MDGPGMSERERRILAMIESELRADEALDRELSEMRARRHRSRARPTRLLAALGSRTPTGLVVLLTAFALGLTTVVAQIRTPVAFTLLGLAWGVAIALVVIRATARHEDR